ncbi:MAG: hypothetical protein H6754_03670 [Candidatus Omnitrophica bacterium]|nr:hypothetical protein [Candidatus Omnitrophota bacterium]
MDADKEISKEPLRALIFGSQADQVRQMSDQLTRKKIVVRAVLDEKLLLSRLSEFNPDLIFIEINGVTRSPVEQIVKIVFLWTTNYARKVNKALNSPSARLWTNARVIMYKSDVEGDIANPAGVTITDLDEVLFKCKEIGDIKYIGLYSSWSFYSKIEPLLVADNAH